MAGLNVEPLSSDFDEDEEIGNMLAIPVPADSEEDDGEGTTLIYPLLPPEQVYAALDAELEDADAAAIRLNPYNPR
jgi:hypothetical protein